MNVLVADDNHVNQKLISMHLTTLGCTHIPVWHGQQALDYLANPSNPRPDIILLKFSMPVKGGLEVAYILRTQAPFVMDTILRVTSVIGMMPNPMRGDWERYAHNGYLDDILRKPVKLMHLRGMLLRWSRKELAPGVLSNGRYASRPIWGPFPLRA